MRRPGAFWLALSVLALLAACDSKSVREPSLPSPASIAPAPRAGGYYQDDGPGENPPADIEAIPDAVPRLEPLHRFANRPYSVFGQDYVPATTLRPYKERGVASWYGRKFHQQKTSTGEAYDMYAMTAAHPTLPLPSYARVTNVATGKSVVVRVNDRGPFHAGRIIDLSYSAAAKLGLAQHGSGQVDVESILPDAAPVNVATAALPAVAPLTDLPAAQAMTVAPARGGFVVQLGAFANYANARAFASNVENQFAGSNVEPRVREADGFFRVFVGPFADRDDAKRTAQRLREAVGLDSTVRAQ